MQREDGDQFIILSGISKTLDNRDICARLGVNTNKANRFLRKFGKKVGARRVITDKELESLVHSGKVIKKGGVVYF